METQVDRKVLVRRIIMFLLVLIAAAAIMIANIQYNQKRASIAKDKVGLIRITDPERFWGNTKYLVIMVR